MDKKVLIIDDEEQDRKAMTIALEKAGFSNISCADTGQKGIEMAKSIKPDVVVIDVVLRSVDGFDVCKQLKAAEELTTKVLMITGHLEAVICEKARQSGADELIVKTPAFEDIGQAIDNLFKR